MATKHKTYLRCRLGYHKGEWVYESPTSCKQKEICARCGKELYPPMFFGHKELTSWDFAAPDDCRRLATCLRCGETEYFRPSHSYSEPTYENPDSCRMASVCERCGDVIKFVQHIRESDYADYYESCRTRSICKRCGCAYAAEPDDCDEDMTGYSHHVIHSGLPDKGSR